MDARADVSSEASGKRNLWTLSEMEDAEEDDGAAPRSEAEDTKKQNHSEIEKRRRDKMNMYISEMSSLVPMCKAMSRKLDKLTVLRMAVQHIKTLRGSINSYTEGHYKPPWLTDEELKNVILEAADGFLFVVSCDRGRILFMSESVQQTLSYSQGDLLGQSWFDILHPKDIAKVKEQLSSSDLSPKERLIDAKTMLPLKGDFPQRQSRLCPGARRSFFCRMRCKTQATVKEEADTTTGGQRRRKSHSFDRRYSIIHCTGYLKSWAPTKLSLPEEGADTGDSEGCNLSCLVAVGRVHGELTTAPRTRASLDVEPIEFVSRHAIDGKFLFVDKKATLILGYLPQELLGTACYEYYSQEDVLPMSECHKKVLQTTESVCTQPYKFRVKGGSFVCLQTKWKTFKNPWTKEFECLVATNTLLRSQEVAIVDSSNGQMDELLAGGTAQPATRAMDAVLRSLPPGESCAARQSPLAGRLGAGKVGRQVVEHVLGARAQDASEGASSSTLPEAAPLTAASGQPSTTEEASKTGPSTSSAGTEDHNGNSVPADSPEARKLDSAAAGFTTTSPGSVATAESDAAELELMDSLVSRDMLSSSGTQGNSEGNDEAAMAVIMSLLEADAGLGGPVDFSGIPWPLP
ncbi:protein cycle [Ixodes scapularis]|uniref:protein cycle n=1 Tax=Ixodes scapularis TaxID=6945 RepID=UPI001A9F82EB|nr:protein cycle [Ixodes scapularis]XP_029845569.2 protein cycle [Ixodes scapularis]XP_040078328.1 protein cycle [Ixodes scapularis]